MLRNRRQTPASKSRWSPFLPYFPILLMKDTLLSDGAAITPKPGLTIGHIRWSLHLGDPCRDAYDISVCLSTYTIITEKHPINQPIGVCVNQPSALSAAQYRWCLTHNETQWDDVDQRERPRAAVTGDRLGALAEGKHRGGPHPSERGSSQPHKPLLTPSTATHSRVRPSGLASTPTGWFTSPAY